MKKIFTLSFCLFYTATLLAQDTSNVQEKVSATEQHRDSTDIMNMIEGSDPAKTVFTKATFKTTRLINGHSVETLGKGVMDVKISHRFGKVNGGGYELFGLDNATMRFGFDYGLTNDLMIGIGRSTFEKTYDAFLKVKILKQSTGKINMPVTMDYIPTIAITTLRTQNPTKSTKGSSRISYTHQLIIGRKFSEKTSLQLMPGFVHQNLVTLASDPNNLYAIGIGGRRKISKRTSFNMEYYYQLPGAKLAGTSNSLSAGFDIETGGHVFQLHLTNSQGMTERSFISNTTGKWHKGDIFFGFNIARVFNVAKHKK